MFMLLSSVTPNLVKAQGNDQDTTALHFLILASIGNLHEITAGKMAAQKASRPDIRAFGQRMVTDHTNVQDALLKVARANGYQLPPQATSKTVPEPSLVKATGTEFDRLYVHMMVPGHRQTVLLYQTYAITGKNPLVKAFAQKALPTLKAHLTAVTAIDKQLKEVAK